MFLFGWFNFLEYLLLKLMSHSTGIDHSSQALWGFINSANGCGNPDCVNSVSTVMENFPFLKNFENSRFSLLFSHNLAIQWNSDKPNSNNTKFAVTAKKIRAFCLRKSNFFSVDILYSAHEGVPVAVRELDQAVWRWEHGGRLDYRQTKLWRSSFISQVPPRLQ